MKKELQDLINTTNYARDEVKEVDEKRGANYRFLNKKIINEKLIYSPSEKNMSLINENKYGKISLSTDKVKNNNKTLLLEVDGNVENMNPRPGCGIRINLDKIDLTKFNRIRLSVYLEAQGYQNMYFHFFCSNDDEKEIHAVSVYANQWNEIVWEINDLKRDNVNRIDITPFLFGCPPESDGNIKIYIDNIYADKVAEDYDFGWDLDDRLAYCHSGYYCRSKKVALTQKMNNDIFYIIDKNGIIIYENNKELINTINGIYYKLDFSKLTKKGEYYIKYDDKISNMFIIDNNPFEESILKSLNFLRLLRCGEDIKGVHSACHLNCRSIHSDGRSVPNFGGWHDAGDLSQFEIPTAEMTEALIDLANNTNDENMRKRILEEAKVGSDWLLRTTFHDGSRALAISYKLWRDNLLQPNNNGVSISGAENGPFENYLSAAALASVALAYKESYPIYSQWCLRVAKEDFDFAYQGYENKIYTKRWGPNIDSQVCGHGIIAATELYKNTNDQKYIDIAKKYALIVLKCQQSTLPKWDNPIRGFFYEDIDHKYILSYEHRGHEQSPIQGLCRLYQLLPNDIESSKWLKGIKLYREYIMNTMYSTEPYNFIPGNIYDINKINIKRVTYTPVVRTDEEAMELLKEQVMEGIKLNEGIYLRKFPIAVQRRGFHATLLSKTKGLSEVGKVLKDKKIIQLCIDQLEWILGKNPFASSTMFGEGYNYHPLYVAYSRQMVGALPVGIMTKGKYDMPFWPTRDNAVYKEIWGHTTGKYLWVLADIISFYRK